MNQILNYLACARLNLRVAHLMLQRKWISREDTARSYDRLSPDYDTLWLRHLRPVTDTLLTNLPVIPPGGLIDLGCGTGYTTVRAAERYPGRGIVGVDISVGMLHEASQRVNGHPIRLVRSDMLKFLQLQPSMSTALILSAWAIGYSKPTEVIRQAGRLLPPGGALAVVVNYADTLAPVFRAFRQCMAQFPGEVCRITIPRFPSNWNSLQRPLKDSGFQVLWQKEGNHIVVREWERPILPWLLRTGILAGFDIMLPLQSEGPVAAKFEELVATNRTPIAHHYVAFVARRI
jgi:trans-aconitate 2-methyltransferase